MDSSLIDDVLQLRSREARGTSCECLEADIFRCNDLLHMMCKNRHAATDIRKTNHNISVETTRSSQSLVQHLGEVSGSQDDDSAILLETIQFGEQLVERLFDICSIPGVSFASNGVEFVDKNNSRGFAFCSREQISDSLGANSNVDFIKLTTRHEEERDTSFSSNSSSEESLSGSRRANK